MPILQAALLAALLAAGPADDLAGVWKAKQRFGPDARGTLVLQKSPSGWSADFAGRSLPVRAEGAKLAFELSDGQGSFEGTLQPDGHGIAGHWITPNSVVNGSRYAVPVVLEAEGPDRWRGSVVPRDDNFTLYLVVQQRPDGTLGAFLRNPDRNIGVFVPVDRIVREGREVRLLDKSGELLLSGVYDSDREILSVFFPQRGGTFDFRREGEQSYLYPRWKNPGKYAYRPPLARDDGWPTGTLEEADIDRAGIETFIQMVLDRPIESVHTPQIEGLLVARHGKLVLEEYFHGEHRDKLHESRSAAKSLTVTVVGAALQAGAPLELSSPVYKVMNGGEFPADLEPRKRAMTLEHLLTMSSGYFCDDSNPDAPGREDRMLDQSDEPDYYRYTLKIPMAMEPGEQSVYCSINPNLALGMVSRATGESPLETFSRLLAGPMKIRTYAWPLDPAGHPYGGGGVQLLPRDFLKLGQLMLDGGTWQGRRILSRDFAARASSPLRDLNNIRYGFLWWNIEYPYKDRTVRAYFAGGNGGQGIIVVPDLGLVLATFGGNYADRVGLHIQQELAPNYILPAVREPGDDKNAPVVQRSFVTPYGRKRP
ncbi:MAG TPA: serine hydrolase [Thermoanaerobaculia bacterium]|nr:serine hydrolase [Thermoanaerobaculia bacterium]